MGVGEVFSRLKGLKHRFKGRKRNQDRESVGTSGGRTDVEESLSRSESPFVGDGDRDREGSGASTVGGNVLGWLTPHN